MPPLEEYIDEIKSVWETSWMTNMGKIHNQLEQELVKYLEVDNISLFTNGHLALELLLQAMNLEGEVITTPFTFASTTHAIVRNNLTPVFCDINKNDYTIDVTKIEELITDRTCAILPVHVYGNLCDIYEINRLAKKYDLKVIYDAAHAFGEKIDGQGIGNFGDASMFSFHATKVFNTIEGGAVCFKNDELVSKLNDMKNFGIRGPESCEFIGGNAKMNEFQAAMGICNLRHLKEEISKRKNVVDCYRQMLSNIKGIKLCIPQKDVDPILHICL
jgi:dTDP-4-amino-4,6-dideoxygalactose transaminase